jgi:phage terminase large subunit-like protein
LHDKCCPYEIKACQRHLDDLQRQGTKDFPWVFDETRAERIYRWFAICIQVRGVDAGTPYILEDWQKFDLGCVYGWVHKDTGARRFVRTYNKRARGNYKTAEKACQALYHMCADVCYPPYQPELASFELEPEVSFAAVNGRQADKAFLAAYKTAKRSPKIGKRMILPKSSACSSKTLGGEMWKITKDNDALDGGAASYYLVDEYHAHRRSDVYELGLNSFGKRKQPLLDCITTAGDDAEAKPCFTEERYCKMILDGDVQDERYFVMIREVPAGVDPHDRKHWLWANPVLRNCSTYGKYLRDEMETEYPAAFYSGDPEKLRKFLTRRLCQWQAASVNSYLTAELLDKARACMVSTEEFRRLTDGRECYCGFDLGKRIDLSGVGAVFLLPDKRVAICAHGFLPEESSEHHEHTDRMPYKAWAMDGYCTLTPGAVTDNSYVYDWICEGERGRGWQVREVDYDGHNATDLAIKICEDRNNDDFVVEISQSCAGQNMAVKGFRELLMQGLLVLEYNPLLLRCLANAVEVQNNFGDIKLSKRHKDDSQRIDPLAAVMNALARALIQQAQPPTLAERLDSGDWRM